MGGMIVTVRPVQMMAVSVEDIDMREIEMRACGSIAMLHIEMDVLVRRGRMVCVIRVVSMIRVIAVVFAYCIILRLRLWAPLAMCVAESIKNAPLFVCLCMSEPTNIQTLESH